MLVFGLFGAAGCLLAGWPPGEVVVWLSRVLVGDAGAPSLVSSAAPAAVAPEPPAEFKERLSAAGAKTGDVQLSLIWFNRNDLDLHCIDPSGFEISYSQRKSRTGGELDVDRNAGCVQPTDEPVENIFWPVGGAPNGIYRVFVNFYSRCPPAPNQTTYKVNVLHGAVRKEFSGTITKDNQPSDKRLIYEFEVGPQIEVFPPAEAKLPRGASVKVPIAIRRSFFQGPVTLTAADLPPGVTAKSVVVPADKTTAEMEMTLGPSAAAATMTVKITATGDKATGSGAFPLTVTAPGFLAYVWKILETAAWTAVVAAALTLALVVGQNYYLSRPLFPGRRGLLLAAGSAAAGFASGFTGQALSYLFASVGFSTLGFVAGWLLLGGLLGFGVSYFIPNLHATKAAIAGLVGGAVGVAAYFIGQTVVGSLAAAVADATTGRLIGDSAGRMAGAVVLGFCIGVMVAMVEAAFRRVWLEVRHGPREIITVNLGPDPVRVGGDARQCTVWARGAAPVALKYWIRSGRVVCGDVVAGREIEVAAGDQRSVGGVEIIVRAGAIQAKGAEIGNAPRPASAPPVQNPMPAPAGRKPDPFDDLPAPSSLTRTEPKPAVKSDPFDDLPMPVTSGPRPPAPSGPPKGSVPPTRPSAPPGPPKPTTVSPPAGPTSLAAADQCPGCKRKVAGRPGARYCMMCDRTF